MSVGIFKNGKYNKVAGNAKDSTAANTTYNNGTSGLQANNVQSAIDELDSTIDTLNSNLTTKTESQVTNGYGTLTIIVKNGICTLSGNLSGLPVGLWTTMFSGLPTPHTQLIAPALTTDSTKLVCVVVSPQGDLLFYSDNYSSVSVSLTYQINY